MTVPMEPRPTASRSRVPAGRCLLLADGAPAGPSLLAALRRARAERGDLHVHVVVPVRPALAAALAVGDPLAGWVVVDSRAAYEWEQASRQDARRRLDELLWLLWEMEVPATGQVVAEELTTALFEADVAAYDTVLVTRARYPLARWRQARWVRRMRRRHSGLELVGDR